MASPGLEDFAKYELASRCASPWPCLAEDVENVCAEMRDYESCPTGIDIPKLQNHDARMSDFLRLDSYWVRILPRCCYKTQVGVVHLQPELL